MKSASWLYNVERILTSETENLRELSQISGVDPGVLFLGTCMDGADLSGQDLRGFRFTHLDLGKVVTDSLTILPNDIKDEAVWSADVSPHDAESTAIGAVLFESMREAQLYASSAQGIRDALDVYGPDQVNKYLDKYEGSESPTVVVTDAATVLKRGLAYGERISGLITISPVGSSKDWFDLIEISRLTGCRMVLIPYGRALTGYPGDHRASIAKALAFAFRNWRALSLVLDRDSVIAAFFERGVIDPRKTWIQVYEKSASCRPSPEEMVYVVAPSHLLAGIKSETLNALFPKISVVSDVLIDDRSDIALLVPASYGHFPNRSPGEIAARVLAAVGWKIAAVKRYYGGRKPDFQIIGSEKYSVNLHESEFKRSKAENTAVDVKEISFRDIAQAEIFVGDFISEEKFVRELIYENKIWMPLKDLLQFRPEERTVWRLIGLQSLRLARSKDSKIKAEFVRWLLDCSIIHGLSRQVELFDHALETLKPDNDDLDIKISSRYVGPDDVILTANITSGRSTTHKPDGEKIRLDIYIDEFGPQFTMSNS